MKLKIQARAKINWTLDVVGTLPNGYHDLDMLMQRIELADEIYLERAQVLSLSVNGQHLPTDGRNLVLKAAEALGAPGGMFYLHIDDPIAEAAPDADICIESMEAEKFEQLIGR